MIASNFTVARWYTHPSGTPIVHDRHTRYRINAGQRAFCYRGVKIWNNLSKDLREIINTKVFKRRLLNELISNMN